MWPKGRRRKQGAAAGLCQCKDEWLRVSRRGEISFEGVCPKRNEVQSKACLERSGPLRPRSRRGLGITVPFLSRKGIQPSCPSVLRLQYPCPICHTRRLRPQFSEWDGLGPPASPAADPLSPPTSGSTPPPRDPGPSHCVLPPPSEPPPSPEG